MNELSWLLLAADTFGTLKDLAIFGTVATGVAIPVVAMMRADDYHEVPRAPRRLVIACVSLALASALFPSETTIYAIAASEVGEDALQLKTGGKAVKALDAWLDKQLKETEQ